MIDTDTVKYAENITCSWSATIPDGVVLFGKENDPKEWHDDGGIIHVINEENFIFLEKTEDEPCQLQIKLSDPCTKITNVSVVSEARIVELYGKYGEYIKTCKCEHISEADGRDFYGAQTDLLTSEEITIKFPGAKEGIWIYGIKFLVEEAPPSITSSFDYNLVDDKLKKSNIPLTEKAEQFKKFLHDYAASKYSAATTNVDPHKFLKMMEGECMSHLRPVETAGRNISKYLSNLIPAMKNNDTAPQQDSTKKEVSTDTSTNDQEKSQAILKEYLDEHIQKLEERLEDKLKKQLQELESRQNEKLDSILALIKSSSLR